MRGPSGFDTAFGAKICPFVDEECVVAAPLDALRAGASSNADVLVGTNREEMNLYFVPTGLRKAITAALAKTMLSTSMPQAQQVLAAYGLSEAGENAGGVFTDAMNDLMFRAGVRQLALAHRGTSHVYEFTWRSPACDGELGACHGLELPFVFKNLATCTGARGIAGENPPETLSESINKLWVSFATSCSFPWPTFSESRRAVYDLATGIWSSEPALIAEAFLPWP